MRKYSLIIVFSFLISLVLTIIIGLPYLRSSNLRWFCSAHSGIYSLDVGWKKRSGELICGDVKGDVVCSLPKGVDELTNLITPVVPPFVVWDSGVGQISPIRTIKYYEQKGGNWIVVNFVSHNIRVKDWFDLQDKAYRCF